MRGAPYPRFLGTRVALNVAARDGTGLVAGRVTRRGADLWLADASGEVPLDAAASEEELADGDWVSGHLTPPRGGRYRLDRLTVHTRRLDGAANDDLGQKLPLLERRGSIVAAARGFFADRGFLEVDTPARVGCPGLEPHLVAFPAGGSRYLITSPELHLKRLLAAGVERLVEFARVFRDDEAGPWHQSEFTMIEWYRTFCGLDALETDCEELVAACAVAAESGRADLGRPFERTTVRQALCERTGIDIATCGGRSALAAAVRDRGHPIAGDDTWDDLFFRIWIAEVEPHLGLERPVFVHDYPAGQAALARTRREPWGEVAERFELYIGGVEVANAFLELNDPAEQRRRHEADRRARREAGRPVYPLDAPFLSALLAGMPPAAGIALGLDRLVALLCGRTTLDDVTAFPDGASRRDAEP